MPSKLDQLRAMTVVVADTGDLDAVRRLKPQDCTTNPTLLLKAVENPGLCRTCVEEALAWGRRQGGSPRGRGRRRSATGSRSPSAPNSPASCPAGSRPRSMRISPSTRTRPSRRRARIIGAYEERGIGRERILIKIASTWEGIRAAEILQKEGIDCNLTLLFCQAQALACAEAGVFLISPFVGRILDWHVKAGGGPYTGETDPGVLSVRKHLRLLQGAGHQDRGDGRLLPQYRRDRGARRLRPAHHLARPARRAGEGRGPPAAQALAGRRRADRRRLPRLDEKSFRFALNEDAMATEKLAEGIRAFVKDLRALRTLVAQRLDEAKAA